MQHFHEFFAGLKYGLITLSGKTYTYKDVKVVGKDNMVAKLTNEQYIEIEKEIWERMK